MAYPHDDIPASVVLKPLLYGLTVWAIFVPLLIGVLGRDVQGRVGMRDDEGFSCWMNVDYPAAPNRNGEAMFWLQKSACRAHKRDEPIGVRAVRAFGLDWAILRSGSRAAALDALLAAARRVSPLALLFLIAFLSELPALRSASNAVKIGFLGLAAVGIVVTLFMAYVWPAIIIPIQNRKVEVVLGDDPRWIVTHGRHGTSRSCVVWINYQAKPGLAPTASVDAPWACGMVKKGDRVLVRYAYIGEWSWETIEPVAGGRRYFFMNFQHLLLYPLGLLVFFLWVKLETAGRKKASGPFLGPDA